MEFEDEAIVLGARNHGETGAIVHLLTREHGVYATHIAGGASRRIKPLLQAGSNVLVTYRARHSDQLGSATLEATGGHLDLLDEPLGLLGLQTACAMTQLVLPEREAHSGAFYGLSALLTAFAMPEIWPAIYVRYEAGLLEELGFGLDLSACAVTGVTTDLTHVSPKTGRAVSREPAKPYCDRLLRLPQFLIGDAEATVADLADAFRLTGHFLHMHVWDARQVEPPSIRDALVEALTAG